VWHAAHTLLNGFLPTNAHARTAIHRTDGNTEHCSRRCCVRVSSRVAPPHGQGVLAVAWAGLCYQHRGPEHGPLPVRRSGPKLRDGSRVRFPAEPYLEGSCQRQTLDAWLSLGDAAARVVAPELVRKPYLPRVR